MMTPFMKFRLLLVIIVLAISLGALFFIDYSDLSFQNNRTDYLTIIIGLIMAGLGLWANKIEAERNNRKNLKE
ncbi:MAG: hypothetical protein V2I54_11540 [Bacteroidales bacterium]|jgi:hypothetical protein|nr:hypothetical protein [Bacteroidales bacterium]